MRFGLGVARRSAALASSQRTFAAFPQALRTGPAAATAGLSLQPAGEAAAPPRAPIQVRGRQYLPGHWAASLPETLAAPRPDFPLLVNAEGGREASPEEWAKAARELFDKELHKYGAVCIRDMPMKTPQEFGRFVRGLGWRTTSLGDYVRCMEARSMTSTVVDKEVRTASDDPPAYTIEPHNEWHTAGFPRKIMLYCTGACEKGGEWPLGDGRGVLKSLEPAVLEKFERLGVRYTVFYEPKEKAFYNCWEENVAPTRPEVENYLKALKYEWKWHDDGALSYWQNFPVTTTHPVTGEKVWFNQLHAHHETFYKKAHPLFVDKPDDYGRWPVTTCYGDGSAIEDDVLEHIRKVTWENCVGVTPEPGMLLFCDNMLVKHGRMGFEGKRDIYVAVTYE